jgi:hypothetical protein
MLAEQVSRLAAHQLTSCQYRWWFGTDREVFTGIGVLLAAMLVYANCLIVALARRGTVSPNRFGHVHLLRRIRGWSPTVS